MHPVSIGRTLAALSFCMCGTLTAGAETPSPAVVELFTSEGCSSCPPGETVLSALENESRTGGLPVTVLEWHVDYWDYLGWKDRFGSAEATQRQYRYARSLPSQVYTPQIVVNGTAVPSYAGDGEEVRGLVRQALRRTAAAHIEVEISSSSPGTLELQVASRGIPSTARIQAVLTEGGLGSKPTAGENTGRNLVHSRVVRRTQLLDGTQGLFPFALPDRVDRTRASIVLLVQDQGTMAILAACQAPLAGAKLTMRSQWKGRVVDGSGNGLSHVALQACSDRLCVPGTTDSRGNFAFESLPPGTYSLSVGTQSHVSEATLAAGQSFDQTRAIVLP